ncbi:MAG: DUF3780 domain-containing protein [Methylomicrobium sp.]|nr:DUF3780 domain-containing protein [Methylomicrobium sp.]
MATRKKDAAQPIVHPTLGFGVPATSNPHHFVVEIPRNNTGSVSIVENLGMQTHDQSQSEIPRVILERTRWTAIRGEVQRAFNVRLKERNLKTATWKVGENPVDRLLGKELCVLAWAIEGMDFDHVPIAVRNWLALRPEERWWLFGMTAITTGGVNDGHKGWRLALRHALGDVAQNQLFSPRQTPAKVQSTEQDSWQGTYSLFDFD